MRAPTLLLALLLALAPLPPTRAWGSSAEMTRAQYMLVGRYMVRHFERAEEMLTAGAPIVLVMPKRSRCFTSTADEYRCRVLTELCYRLLPPTTTEATTFICIPQLPPSRAIK